MGISTKEIYRVAETSDLRQLIRELNIMFGRMADRHDQQEGLRGTPKFSQAPDMQGNRVTNLGVPQAGADAQRFDLCLSNHAGPFDAHGLQIVNVAAGQAGTDAVNKQQMEQAITQQQAIQLDNDVANVKDVDLTSQVGGIGRPPHADHQHKMSQAAWGTPGQIGVTISNVGKFNGLFVDVVPTGSLPLAGASQDGRVIVENAGGGVLNLIIYGAGTRARIAGVAF